MRDGPKIVSCASTDNCETAASSSSFDCFVFFINLRMFPRVRSERVGHPHAEPPRMREGLLQWEGARYPKESVRDSVIPLSQVKPLQHARSSPWAWVGRVAERARGTSANPPPARGQRPHPNSKVILQVEPVFDGIPLGVNLTRGDWHAVPFDREDTLVPPQKPLGRASFRGPIGRGTTSPEPKQPPIRAKDILTPIFRSGSE